MDGQRLLYAGGPGKGKLDVIIYIKQERAFHVIDLEGGNSTLISEIVLKAVFIRSFVIYLFVYHLFIYLCQGAHNLFLRAVIPLYFVTLSPSLFI